MYGRMRINSITLTLPVCAARNSNINSHTSQNFVSREWSVDVFKRHGQSSAQNERSRQDIRRWGPGVANLALHYCVFKMHQLQRDSSSCPLRCTAHASETAHDGWSLTIISVLW